MPLDEMDEQDAILIAYILDSIEKISSISENNPDFKNKLFSEWILHDAVMHRLQTLSESTQRLSLKVKNFAVHLPWKSIAGFRNILVHQYLGDLNPELIWQIIKHELPKLSKVLTEYKSTKLS